MADQQPLDKDLTRKAHAKGAAVLAALLAGIDWFIPPHVRDEDMDLLRRARLVVAFGWTLIFVAVIYAVIFNSLSSPRCVTALVEGIGVGIGSLFIMRRTGSCCATGNLITAAFFGVLTVMACRLGGHGALVLPWYAAIPVVALITAGRRSAVFWLVIPALSLATFYGMYCCGYTFSNELAPQEYAFVELLSLISLSGLMLALALLYETAKSHTLAELRTAEARVQREKSISDSLIASLPGVFFLFEGEGRFLRWNEEFERVTGYSPDELCRMQAVDFFRGRDRESISQGIADVFAKGQATVEACFTTKNEEAIPHVFNGRHVVLDGRIHLIGTGIDIAERKRIEAALQKRLVAPTRPLEGAESITFEELFHLEDIQRLQNEIAQAMGVSSIITRTDGTPITAPSNFTRLCRDIIRATEKGRALCMQSDATLGRLNPNGPTIQRCTSAGLWSAGAAISVGGKHIANWIIGQVRDDRQTEEDIRKYAREIAADEEAVVEAICEVPTMSQERHEQVAQVLFTLANQLSNMAYQNVQQARFITERERIEGELARAKDDAEAATQAKSEFLANMSHEVRTPMTAILGFSDILMESEMDPEQLETVATIRRNGEYLIQIINDILDLSKIEAGKMEIEHIPCSPKRVLAEVVSLMRVRANEKNLPLEIEFDGFMPTSIRSDPVRLRQILINLTSNAVKFTEAGKVRLAARILDAGSNDPKLQIDVIDSGIGMSEEQAARLFKPFTQVDSSTTRQYGGTGLGLAISKRLARQLGGDITVKSVWGEGTTFTLTLTTGPLGSVDVLGESGESLSPGDSCDKPDALCVATGCRVLLAEDGPDNQRFIAFLLRKESIDVVVADNGEMACDLALGAWKEGTPFDVILMDMQMPVMDGYDATRKLREAGYGAPIIAVTAHAMSTDREKCLHAGCDDYLTKPIDRRKLTSLVFEYASSRKQHCRM